MDAQLMNNRSIEVPVRFFRFFPGDEPHGETTKIDSLDPDHTVLLLIDVYHAAEKPQARDLVHSRWDQEFWKTIKTCLVPLIRSSREVGLPIIYISNSSPRIEINNHLLVRDSMNHWVLIQRLIFENQMSIHWNLNPQNTI